MQGWPGVSEGRTALQGKKILHTSRGGGVQPCCVVCTCARAPPDRVQSVVVV
jgi:hypothetical protein